MVARTALKERMLVSPKRPLKYAGQENAGVELLAAIAERESVLGQRAGNTGRTKDCIPRLLCMIVSDAQRAAVLQARLPCSKQQLDNKETGKSRRVWTRLSADFWNKGVRVRASNTAVDRVYTIWRWTINRNLILLRKTPQQTIPITFGLTTRTFAMFSNL